MAITAADIKAGLCVRRRDGYPGVGMLAQASRGRLDELDQFIMTAAGACVFNPDCVNFNAAQMAIYLTSHDYEIINGR